MSDNWVIIALIVCCLGAPVILGVSKNCGPPKPGKPDKTRQTTLQRARQSAKDAGCKRISLTDRREFKDVKLDPGDCLLSIPKDDVPILVTSEGEQIL